MPVSNWFIRLWGFHGSEGLLGETKSRYRKKTFYIIISDLEE